MPECVLIAADQANLALMARTSRKFAIAHGVQFAAQRLLGDDCAEFLPNPLDRQSAIARRRERPGSGRRDAYRSDDALVRALSIDQTGQPMSVELEHRIANNMKRQAANLRRLGARRRFTRGEVQEIHGVCRNLRRGGTTTPVSAALDERTKPGAAPKKPRLPEGACRLALNYENAFVGISDTWAGT